MTNTISGLDGAHELLIKLVDQAPDDWAMRKKVAQVLYDARYYRDASQMIWSAPEIPPIGEDVVFSARVVAKGQPTRAMRLINTVIEKNLGHPEDNLEMAKLFLKADMRLQAIRFYGAAVALDANLIDEHFEISLLKADVESLPWSEEVMSDDFPWEGPDLFEETESEEAKEDAHIALLNGLTQPVPIKASLSETKRQVAQSKPKPEKEGIRIHKEEPETEEVEVQAEEAKPEVEKTAPEPEEAEVEAKKEEPEIKPEEPEAKKEEPEVEQAKPEPERKLPTWKVQEGRAIFDPNRKKDDEPALEVVTKKPKVELPPVEVAEAKEVEVVDEPQAEKVQEDKTEAREETAPVAESSEVEETKEEAQDTAQPAFFKSYDDAHQHNGESVSAEDKAPSEASGPVSVEAKQEVFKAEPAQSGGDDLAGYVADAMAEYESSAEEIEEKPQENGVVSALSSLVNRFRKKKTEEKPESEEEKEIELSDDAPEQAEKPPVLTKAEPAKTEPPVIQPAAATEAPAPAPAPTPAPEPKPAAVEKPAAEAKPKPVAEQQPVKLSVAEAKPSPLDRPGVHTSAQKLVEQSQPEEQEEPKELDGRTQLVALAPEDGAAYFEQLVAKYSNVPSGQVPRAVAVARDMANADYLKLIQQACDKDLDAFSKLLGLHRAMSANQCTDWGEDMNLLRKGYGDAVLATVVSKYSVSECREILNSVYQHPASAAAV